MPLADGLLRKVATDSITFSMPVSLLTSSASCLFRPEWDICSTHSSWMISFLRASSAVT